jgi:hypothetical protein
MEATLSTETETVQRSALSSRVRLALGWHVSAKPIAGIGCHASCMMDPPVLKGRTRGLRPEGVNPGSRPEKFECLSHSFL